MVKKKFFKKTESTPTVSSSVHQLQKYILCKFRVQNYWITECTVIINRKMKEGTMEKFMKNTYAQIKPKSQKFKSDVYMHSFEWNSHWFGFF